MDFLYQRMEGNLLYPPLSTLYISAVRCISKCGGGCLEAEICSVLRIHSGEFRAEDGMMVIFRTFTRVSNRCDKQNDDYGSGHSSDILVGNLCHIVIGGSGRVPLCESYVNDNYLTQLDLIKRLYRIPPNDVFDVDSRYIQKLSA